MGRKGCPKNPVNNYQPTARNIPENGDIEETDAELWNHASRRIPQG